MPKAVVFDIDNTLTDNTSWLRITELLGASVPTLQDILGRFLRNELPHADAEAEVLELWRQTGNANRIFLQAMIAAWPLRQDAQKLVHYVQSRGYQTALITGSVDLFAEGIAQQLGVPHYYSNTRLDWDDHGELSGLHYVRDQAGLKLQQLKSFSELIGVQPTDCIVVADGDNDVETFRATQHGIVVGNATPSILRVSWKHADTLSDAIDIIASNS